MATLLPRTVRSRCAWGIRSACRAGCMSAPRLHWQGALRRGCPHLRQAAVRTLGTICRVQLPEIGTRAPGILTGPSCTVVKQRVSGKLWAGYSSLSSRARNPNGAIADRPETRSGPAGTVPSILSVVVAHVDIF